ncbi:YtxH domain-containing protein [Pedobacter sp.]|jgi:gas vesicle protein|uniref:YtxH domain-containing protein n=1 Tax=Pedobacter sp. TaxID=1411316 RepID=UPI002CB69514|nr:YtxH domain-containing protein [Pedobacter sp.]HWW37893.1 YtxH domain-containing protein [Pedobacter sp.]
MKRNTSLSVLGFITGTATGIAIGLLFAPEKGNNTRGGFISWLIAIANAGQRGYTKEVKLKAVKNQRKHNQKISDKLTDAAHPHELLPLKQTGPKSRQLPKESFNA